MKINETLNGFEIIDIREYEDLKGRAVQMKHKKSGARLLWLDRPDNNKTFSIAFRTIPKDDTGIFHILEHSVLCGSKKYPVKEPFVELLKNSMNTFLNALTFPDKTMYPISSKNDKDFFNLMDVYLDAVFNPAIYNRPEIFYQEGWHYEIDENDNISYKGVVFNEMKGVYADADSVAESAVLGKLFPDSCYSCESGGHPTKIPELSYEAFIEGHKTFYHPSNSYIILDGDMDIKKVTEFIDKGYLSGYDQIAPCPMPRHQKPVVAKDDEVYFEQSKDMPLENQTSIYKAYVIGDFDDKEKIYASHIAASLLCENNQSYLTNAILNEGLAEDVTIRVIDGIYQPYLQLEIKNVDDARIDEIDAFVENTLKEIVQKGIDKDRLEAAISNLEFEIKEKEFGFPRGLVYAMTSLETWLYDGDAVSNLVIGDLFEKLREKGNDGYFESLIQSMILDSNHCCKVTLKPSYTVGDEDRANEQARLDQAKASWSEADFEEYKEIQRKLAEWQSSTDSPEDLAKIPMITLDDIDIEPESLPAELEGNILKHNIQTDGITYLNLFFDVTGVNEEDLPNLSLLCSLLGELDTENHSAKDLKTELMTKCGSISFSVSAFTDYNKLNEGTIRVSASVSALDRYVADAVGLVKEIITSTKFDNKNAIMDVIKQLRQSKYQGIVMSGSAIAMKRSLASISYEGVVSELTGGFAYYQWLKEQENNPIVIDQLSAYLPKVFARNNALLSIANDNASAFDDVLGALTEGLGETDLNGGLAIKPWKKANEGIVIPGDIAFSGISGELSGLYGGKTLLMAHIASLDYLWNEVRVKGGAYGTGLRVSPNDSISAYSYRDPNAPNSVQVAYRIGDYLRDFVKDERELIGFIIGTMSSASPLLTPKVIAASSAANFIRSVTMDIRRKTRVDIVSATLKDLEELSYVVEKGLENASVCIIGSKTQIEKAKVDKIYSL